VLLSPVPVGLGWIGNHYWNCELMEIWSLVTTWNLAQNLIYRTLLRHVKWCSVRVIDIDRMNRSPTGCGNVSHSAIWQIWD